MKRMAFLFFVTFSTSFLASNGLPGADIDPVLKERIDHSDFIVIGKVNNLTGVRENGLIYIIATLSVEKILKGDPQSDEIKIRVLGGSVGDIGLLVSEPVAEFDINERVLTFLQVIKKNPQYHWLFDETEGKYTITANAMIKDEGISLEEIANQIETYLKVL